jgi:hypothetical protein
MLAVTNATAVGWLCFGLGAIVFLAGAALGLRLGWNEPSGATHAKAKAKLEQAQQKISQLTTTAVAAANKEGKDPVAAAEASTTGASAADVVKDFEGLLKALPERLRFSGFLILVGALLMSVATVQFGGHSIF